MAALPVTAPEVPVEVMTAGALARYRSSLERRLRVCPAYASRRAALQAALAGVLAEEAERQRIGRTAASRPG